MMPMSRGFPRHKNRAFSIVEMHTLAFPRHEETSTGVGQPSTNRHQGGREKGGEDIRLVTVETERRLRRMRDGYVKKIQ